MSDEQQHGSVRSLTERAIDFAHAMADYDEYIKTVESLRAEADALDVVNAELLAWVRDALDASYIHQELWERGNGLLKEVQGG